MAFSPTMMRWLQQDPAGYVDGQNAYAAHRDSPIGSVDPFGLWTIKRQGEARAEAIPDESDTIQSLAQQLRLSVSEADKWLILRDQAGANRSDIIKNSLTVPAGSLCMNFSVPNTAYVDSARPEFENRPWTQFSKLSAWQADGIKVVFSKGATVNLAAIRSHLIDSNAFLYLLLAPRDVTLNPIDYRSTSFGLAEMILVADDSHASESVWRGNVAIAGALTTYGPFQTSTAEAFSSPGTR